MTHLVKTQTQVEALSGESDLAGHSRSKVRRGAHQQHCQTLFLPFEKGALCTDFIGLRSLILHFVLNTLRLKKAEDKQCVPLSGSLVEHGRDFPRSSPGCPYETPLASAVIILSFVGINVCSCRAFESVELFRMILMHRRALQRHL